MLRWPPSWEALTQQQQLEGSLLSPSRLPLGWVSLGQGVVKSSPHPVSAHCVPDPLSEATGPALVQY